MIFEIFKGLNEFVIKEYEWVIFNMVVVINRVCNKEGMGYGCFCIMVLSNEEV